MFSFVNVFIKLLLPTLGLPIIVTVNPSLINDDNFAELIEFLIFFCIKFNSFKNKLDISSGISSSEKSIKDSIRRYINNFLSPSINNVT